MKEIKKALYTLTISRVKHRYPNAEDRNKKIKKIIEDETGTFVPERITADIDSFIHRAYEDAFDIKKVHAILDEADRRLGAERMSNKAIEEQLLKCEKTYRDILGVELVRSPRQAPTPVLTIDETEIPF